MMRRAVSGRTHLMFEGRAACGAERPLGMTNSWDYVTCPLCLSRRNKGRPFSRVWARDRQWSRLS